MSVIFGVLVLVNCGIGFAWHPLWWGLMFLVPAMYVSGEA